MTATIEEHSLDRCLQWLGSRSVDRISIVVDRWLAQGQFTVTGRSLRADWEERVYSQRSSRPPT